MPAVVSEPSVQAKNRILCDGIYAYFSESYGTKQPKTDRSTKRRQKHDRALKRAKQLKGNAKCFTEQNGKAYNLKTSSPSHEVVEWRSINTSWHISVHQT